MAWPPTNPVSVAAAIASGAGHFASGDSTFMCWGTQDLIQGPSLSTYYTVTRANQRRKKEDLQYDNGSGVQSGRMQLFHGVQWEFTVRDDTRHTPPTEGTTVTITDMAGHLGNRGLTYLAYVLDSNYDTGQKQPGERGLLIERIRLIEG